MLTGKFGISLYGKVSGFSIALTKFPRPVPHTMPMVGRYLVFSSKYFVMASNSSYDKLNESSSILVKLDVILMFWLWLHLWLHGIPNIQVFSLPQTEFMIDIQA